MRVHLMLKGGGRGREYPEAHVGKQSSFPHSQC